jgi:hypothetical protein
MRAYYQTLSSQVKAWKSSEWYEDVKWQWDEARKSGQFRRYSFEGDLGYETSEEKKWQKWLLSFLRKTEGDGENTSELGLVWEEVEWDERWCKSGGRLFHEAGAARWKDLFVVLRWEL